jgi:hypothetical protein
MLPPGKLGDQGLDVRLNTFVACEATFVLSLVDYAPARS